MNNASLFFRLLDESARSGDKESVRLALAFLNACRDLMVVRVHRMGCRLQKKDAPVIEPSRHGIQVAAQHLLRHAPQFGETIVRDAADWPEDRVLMEFLSEIVSLNP